MHYNKEDNCLFISIIYILIRSIFNFFYNCVSNFTFFIIELQLLHSLSVQFIYICSVNQILFLAHAFTISFYGMLNFWENICILNCGWESVLLTLYHFSHCASQDLSTSCLWKFINEDDMLERSNRTNLFSNQSN